MKIKSLCIPILLIVIYGCLPLKIPKSADETKTEISLYSPLEIQEKINEFRLAPLFSRNLVEQVMEGIVAEDENIIIVDSKDIWKVAFPEYDPDAEVSLSELLSGESREKLQEEDIEFLIILEKYIESGHSEQWDFWAAQTVYEETSCSWFLVQTKNVSAFKIFVTESQGKGHAGWIPAYLLVFFQTYTDPNTEKSTINNLVTEAVSEMRDIKPSGIIKISVIAGALLSYE